MSHITNIQTEIRDLAALRSTCRRLRLVEPVHETVTLFTKSATGHAVRLTDWRYPVVCSLGDGQLSYDNYQGRWGDQAHLDSLLQNYAVEKAKIEARRRGHTLTEQSLVDGSIKLTIQIGGVV